MHDTPSAAERITAAIERAAVDMAIKRANAERFAAFLLDDNEALKARVAELESALAVMEVDLARARRDAFRGRP